MSYIPTGKELIDPVRVLQEAGIKADMKVADFGCGTLGHYVFAASELVGPGGTVYAVDILKSVLNGVEGMIKLGGNTNVELLWGDIERPDGVTLPTGFLDMGMLINNLFLSKEHNAMLRECVRTVKPGGIFVLIDWKPGGAGFGPDPKTRVPADVALRLGMNAGLRLVREIVPGPYHYGYVYTKA